MIGVYWQSTGENHLLRFDDLSQAADFCNFMEQNGHVVEIYWLGDETEPQL